MRAFLVADLARYRAALPGTATGYLALLDEALAAGHRPGADDLAALGALRGNPRSRLLARCAPHPPTAKPTLPAARTPRPASTITLADTAGSTGTGTGTATGTTPAPAPAPPRPPRRPAGRREAAQDPPREPARKPAQEPARKPATPKRPVPPGRGLPPPQAGPARPDSRHHLAAG